jgi:hypothetical protein
VPEMNYTGQFARMIQAEFWREVISVRKYGGTPFATHEIFTEIKKAYEKIKPARKAVKRVPAPQRKSQTLQNLRTAAPAAKKAARRK